MLLEDALQPCIEERVDYIVISVVILSAFSASFDDWKRRLIQRTANSLEPRSKMYEQGRNMMRELTGTGSGIPPGECLEKLGCSFWSDDDTNRAVAHWKLWCLLLSSQTFHVSERCVHCSLALGHHHGDLDFYYCVSANRNFVCSSCGVGIFASKKMPDGQGLA